MPFRMESVLISQVPSKLWFYYSSGTTLKPLLKAIPPPPNDPAPSRLFKLPRESYFTSPTHRLFLTVFVAYSSLLLSTLYISLVSVPCEHTFLCKGSGLPLSVQEQHLRVWACLCTHSQCWCVRTVLKMKRLGHEQQTNPPPSVQI